MEASKGRTGLIILLAVGGVLTWSRLRGFTENIGGAIGSAASSAGGAIGDAFGWIASGIYGTGSIMVLDLLSMFFSGLLVQEGKAPPGTSVVPPDYGSEFYEWREEAIYHVNMQTAPASFDYDDRIGADLAAPLWDILNEAYSVNLANPFGSE